MIRAISNICVMTAISILLFSNCALAKEPPQKFLNSLPLEIKASSDRPEMETFMAKGRNTYADPKLGAGSYVSYINFSGSSIVVSLYEFGVEDIPDGISSELIRRAKEKAIAGEKKEETQGYYSDVKVITDKEMDLSLDTGKTLKVLFVSISENLKIKDSQKITPEFSDFYLCGLKGYICEINASWKAAEKEEEQAVKKAVKILLSNLTQ